MHKFRLTPWRAAGATLVYLALWLVAVQRGAETVAAFGVAGLYFIGLAWIVWGIERAAQYIELRREGERSAGDVLVGRMPSGQARSWNPLDPGAWYYGRHSQRFRQSLAVLGLYSLGCLGVYFLLLPSGAKGDSGVQPYELPEGGGSDQMAGSPAVKIVKVVKKKFVINPYSSIVFSVPGIDKVDLKILELTKNEYKAGQTGISGQGDGTGDGSGGLGSGDGTGGGFGSGTGKGKVRFIRLRHADKSWDKNFGIGGDLNLLNEFAARARWPREKVADQTEYVDFTQLATFQERTAPPMIFVAGSQTFQVSPADKKILRQYLLERNGMIFADNLGGQNFHNQFFAVMREVTGVNEVAIPRDDYIHRRPNNLPSLPIVVANGGTVPYGWNVDGRWVVYYHPGAISDAWRDDHAGIRREVWEE